jgi:transcriptional regulator with XRE-family HTH domain
METDELIRRARSNPQARAGFTEARLRRLIGATLEATMKRAGVTVRELAARVGTSKSQVQRVLNKEAGGSLTLMTVVKAAQALDLDVSLRLAPPADKSAVVVSLHPWRPVTMPEPIRASDGDDARAV